MLGLVHTLDMLGAVAPGDTSTALPMARALVKQGYRPLFINSGSKTPAETRTDAAIKKARKDAQKLAQELGNPNWEKVDAQGGGIHLALDTPGKVKGAHDRALKRQRVVDGEPQPLNLALRLTGERLLVVDCDTAASVAAFTAMAADWGLTIAHPTVLSPGAQDESGAWKHSEGGHFYFEVPEGTSFADVPKFNVGAGSDAVSFMTTDCYVLAPPSRRPEGVYRWLGGVQAMPQKMIDFVMSHEQKPKDKSSKAVAQAVALSGDADDDIATYLAAVADDSTDIADWSRSVSWDSLLTAHGWVASGKLSGCGCPEYTAPGTHASSKSATAHESYCVDRRYQSGEGHAPLHIWTDNVPSELDGYGKTLSKLQFVAAYDHDGDIVAAMKAQDIGIQDQTDYTDLLAVADAFGDTSAPVPTKPAAPSIAAPVPATTSAEPLPGFGPALATAKNTPAVPAAVPTTVQDTVPHSETVSVQADNQGTVPDATLPHGVTDMTAKDAGRGYEEDKRPYAVHDVLRGVRMTEKEHDTWQAMLDSVAPFMERELTDTERMSLARMVVRGENPYDKRMYGAGAAYDPALIQRVFEPYSWTRSIFEHAVRIQGGEEVEHGIANPVASLVRELIRAAHRAPVGLKTWRGNPLSLYGLFLGESGKGKSYAMNTRRLSPWPDADQYGFYRVQGDSYALPEEVADYTMEPRSGQVIPSMFHEQVVEDTVVSQNKEGEDIVKPVKTMRQKSHASVWLEVDELAVLMSLASGDGNTIVDTMNSAYSGRAIGGSKVGDKENTRVTGDYRLQLLGGIQPSRFDTVLEHSASGFPQRLLMVQVTWPWVGLPWKLTGDRLPAAPTATADPLPAQGQFTVDRDILVALAHDSAVNAGVAAEREEDDAIATHLADMQVRIACIGALLDGTLHVDKRMWAWAGYVIEVSRRSYLYAKVRGEQAEHKIDERKGERAAVTQARAEAARMEHEAELFGEVRAALVQHGTLTTRQVTQAVSSSSRSDLKYLLPKWSGGPNPLLNRMKVGRGFHYSLNMANPSAA